MNNIKKISEFPTLFGEDKSKSVIIEGEKLEGLSEVGLNFDGYTLKKGDVLEFPKFEDMIVKSNPVRKGSETLVYYVACRRTRGKVTTDSAFNLNSLSKRDINNEPVYPEFYNLGSLKARLEKLAELGKIWCKETKTIQVQKFSGNVPQYHDEVQEDGTILSVRTPVAQEVAVIAYSE